MDGSPLQGLDSSRGVLHAPNQNRINEIERFKVVRRIHAPSSSVESFMTKFHILRVLRVSSSRYYDPPKGERAFFSSFKINRGKEKNNIFQLSKRSMPGEEVDNKQRPSEINSFHQMISSKNVLKIEAVEVSKKRKFQTDQSELSLLPLSKHACFDNVACSDNTDGRSELASECSTSYVNSCSMECDNEVMMKEESSGSCGEDKMISFESHLDFIYGTQKLEDFSEKDIENILYLDEEEEEEANGCSNASNYVLSSGRWTVNQDSTRQGTKKPTIDQEFEQYFSTLML